MSALLTSRRFWPLFGAQSLGAFADNTLRMATIVACAAAFRTGSEAYSLPNGLGEHAGTIVSVAFTLPVLVFSVLAGQLADKYSRSGLIKRLKLIEVALMAVAATFFALGNGPMLIATLCLMGTQSAFFSPVRNAVMPQYFGPHELVRANGYFNAALFVAVVAGLGLGGEFIGRDGGPVIVSGMLIGAAGLGAMFAMFTPDAPAPGTAKLKWHLPIYALVLAPIYLVRQLVDVSKNPKILLPILGVAWFWMIGAAVLANMPNYVSEGLGGGNSELAQLQAIFAIGAGVGSIAAGLIGGRMKDAVRLSGIGALGTVIGSIAIWYCSRNFADLSAGVVAMTNAPLLVAFVFTAAMNGVFAVPMMAAVQSRAPDTARAQVMGVSNTTNGALATLGALIIVPLRIAGVSATDVFLALGLLQAALFVFMVFQGRSGPHSAT